MKPRFLLLLVPLLLSHASASLARGAIQRLPVPGQLPRDPVNRLPRDREGHAWMTTGENNPGSDTPATPGSTSRKAWWAYLLYLCLAAGGILGARRAIAFHRRIKRELAIARAGKEKAEELARTRLRYFTSIARDLMTPLATISRVVNDTRHDPERAGILRTNIHRVGRLLQEILDFKKIESGNMKLEVSRDDILSFTRRVCDQDFLPLARRDNIVFSLEAEIDHLPAYFDPGKVDKIIFNFLSNAFRYTPRNGFIGLRLQAREEEGHAWLCMKIHAPGPPGQDLSRISSRSCNSNNPRGETNDTALSLARDLVELHHGTISVESEPGQGPTLTIRLPVDREAYRDEELSRTTLAATPDPGQDAIPADDPPGESRRPGVLLVERDEELARVVKRQLLHDYRAYTATDGREALRVTRDMEIDIVISDVVMPGMDGIELCRAIKGNIRTSHVAVILLSAKSATEDRVAGYDAGADAYMTRPFEIKLLKSRINNLLASRKQRQQAFKTGFSLNIAALPAGTLDEKFLAHAIRSIEENLSNAEFGLEVLARDVGMSKSTLYRKIKSMSGLSPHEFIRDVKLKHACRMLREKSVNVSEVAYAVGFSNPKYFTICFNAEFGITPTEYQRQTSPTA